MELAKKERKNILIVDIKGRFDVTTLKDFNDFVNKELKKQSNVGLDFTEVDFVDSSAIGSIVNLLTKLRQRNGKLLIFGMNDDVQSVFQTAKLGNFLDIVTKREFDRLFPDNNVEELKNLGI